MNEKKPTTSKKTVAKKTTPRKTTKKFAHSAINKDNSTGLNFFVFSQNQSNIPTFSEKGKKEWISYGDDNLYGEFLIDLLNNSAKHNSLIKKKVNMTAGKGWEENTTAEQFIKNINGKEDLNDIVFKNTYDLMVYGFFTLAVTWSKDRKSISRISYIDARKVRVAKQSKDKDSELYKRQQDGVEFFFVSSDWNNLRKEENEPQLIQGFSEKYNKDEATQLIFMKEYRCGVDFYTLPDYISAIDYIELDKEISTYNLSSVQGGFTPNLIISFKGGIPTDEEMKKLNKKINTQYAGAKGKKVFTTYSENAESAPDFVPIDIPDSSERFLQLEEQIQKNIIVSHEASPIVAGIPVAGKLGSSSEVIESETMFQRNVIDSKQTLIERVYNKLAKINGVEVDLELKGIKSFEDEKAVEAETVDVEAQARAALKGSVGGVQGILGIQASVAAGTTSIDAGAAILELIYGLPSDQAKRMLGEAPAEQPKPNIIKEEDAE